MILLIDRLPFLPRGRNLREEQPEWHIPLPVVATDSRDLSLPPPRPARFYPWLLDTAYTGQAHIWQTDLPLLGQTPNAPMRPARRAAISAHGERTINLVRPAGLWLFGNMQDRPF